jgi:t-SNARE complex subunit (syntaxin)
MVELHIDTLAELERKAWQEGDKEKSELYGDIIDLVKEAQERDNEINALKDRVSELEQLLEEIGKIVRKEGF